MRCVNTDERLNRSQLLSCETVEVGVKLGGERTQRWGHSVAPFTIVDAVVVVGKSEVDRRNVLVGGSVAVSTKRV